MIASSQREDGGFLEAMRLMYLFVACLGFSKDDCTPPKGEGTERVPGYKEEVVPTLELNNCYFICLHSAGFHSMFLILSCLFLYVYRRKQMASEVNA
jgi:hypothetical protein